jgi:hypothetical protein
MNHMFGFWLDGQRFKQILLARCDILFSYSLDEIINFQNSKSDQLTVNTFLIYPLPNIPTNYSLIGGIGISFFLSFSLWIFTFIALH